MPTYVYRRQDGTVFEIQQRITEDPLVACPETGQPVTRIISGNAGLIFKGDGFYLTDYARKNGNGSSSTEKNDAEAPAAKSESKAASNSTSESTSKA